MSLKSRIMAFVPIERMRTFVTSQDVHRAMEARFSRLKFNKENTYHFAKEFEMFRCQIVAMVMSTQILPEGVQAMMIIALDEIRESAHAPLAAPGRPCAI